MSARDRLSLLRRYDWRWYNNKYYCKKKGTKSRVPCHAFPAVSSFSKDKQKHMRLPPPSHHTKRALETPITSRNRFLAASDDLITSSRGVGARKRVFEHRDVENVENANVGNAIRSPSWERLRKRRGSLLTAMALHFREEVAEGATPDHELEEATPGRELPLAIEESLQAAGQTGLPLTVSVGDELIPASIGCVLPLSPRSLLATRQYSPSPWALVSAGIFHNKPLRSISDVSLRAERCARLDAYIRHRRSLTRPELQAQGSNVWEQLRELASAESSPLCCICFDDAIELPLRCNGDTAHSMCSECAAHLTADSAARPPLELSAEESLAEAYHVTCPVPGCTSHPFGRDTLAAALTDEAGAAAVASMERATVQLTKMLRDAETILLEAEAVGRDDAMIRAQFATPSGTFRAFMCGNCSFGPIEHVNCLDLRSHHGESRGGAVKVSNACPACGWFAPTLNQWKPWDGVVVGQPAAARRKEEKLALSMEKLRELPLAHQSRCRAPAAPQLIEQRRWVELKPTVWAVQTEHNTPEPRRARRGILTRFFSR